MRAFLWILSGFIILINVFIVENSISDFAKNEEKPSFIFYCFVAAITVLYIGNDVIIYVCLYIYMYSAFLKVVSCIPFHFIIFYL